MRIRASLIIPVMKCPKCGKFTDGGTRRPEKDQIVTRFFFICAHCGRKGFGQVDHYEVEVEG